MRWGRSRVPRLRSGYAVTIKPAAGALQSRESGLKILVGYDVLVLVRPEHVVADVTSVRDGHTLSFSNKGNVSVEVVEGSQCDSSHKQCVDLPGKRLYAGATWSVRLPSELPADYTLKSPGKSNCRTY